MELEATGVVLWAFYFVFGALCISLILAFVRLVLGPTLSDRVVALDLVAYVTIAFMITYALATGELQYIEAALVLALIAFLGTVAFARYIEYTSSPAAKGKEEQEA